MFCEAAVSLGVGCAFQNWLKNFRVSWTTIQHHPWSCRIVGSVETGWRGVSIKLHCWFWLQLVMPFPWLLWGICYGSWSHDDLLWEPSRGIKRELRLIQKVTQPWVKVTDWISCFFPSNSSYRQGYFFWPARCPAAQTGWRWGPWGAMFKKVKHPDFIVGHRLKGANAKRDPLLDEKLGSNKRSRDEDGSSSVVYKETPEEKRARLKLSAEGRRFIFWTLLNYYICFYLFCFHLFLLK